MDQGQARRRPVSRRPPTRTDAAARVRSVALFLRVSTAETFRVSCPFLGRRLPHPSLAIFRFNKMGSMGGGGQNQKEAIIASERVGCALFSHYFI